MDRDQLSAIAIALGAAGDGFRKGVLAADESTGTIKKRFDAIGLASTPDTRRDYREILLRSQALGAQISGIILFDETLRQKGADGTPFVDLIAASGALPGIKVDLVFDSLGITRISLPVDGTVVKTTIDQPLNYLHHGDPIFFHLERMS